MKPNNPKVSPIITLWPLCVFKKAVSGSFIILSALLSGELHHSGGKRVQTIYERDDRLTNYELMNVFIVLICIFCSLADK